MGLAAGHPGFQAQPPGQRGRSRHRNLTGASLQLDEPRKLNEPRRGHWLASSRGRRRRSSRHTDGPRRRFRLSPPVNAAAASAATQPVPQANWMNPAAAAN